MGKAMKWGFGIVAAIVVVIAVIFFLALGQLNSIVKAAVEQVGSDITGTDVELDEVDIELTTGKGALRGFRMTNPQGFTSDDAFRFREVSIAIDLQSIPTDTIVIKEIVIDQPEITYELAADDSNLERIKRNTEKNASSGKKPAASGTDSETGKKFIIENVYLRDGTVSARASALLDKKLTVDLPDVHLKDIGKDSGGATPDVIAGQLMDEMLGDITGALGKINIEGQLKDLAGSAQKAVDAVTKQADDALKGAGDAAGGAADSVGGAVDDATSKVKKLFQ